MDFRLRALDHSERSRRVPVNCTLFEYLDGCGEWQPIVEDVRLKDVLRKYRVVRRTAVTRGRTRRTIWNDGCQVHK